MQMYITHFPHRCYQSLIMDPSLDAAEAVAACGEAIQQIIDNNA